MSETPEPEDGNVFTVEQAPVVEAAVKHHAPCVPECPVCYPKGGDD